METLQQITTWIADLPPWAGVVAIVLATFVSEDLTCIGAGLLAAAGELPVERAVWASGLGIFLGDLLLYGAGRAVGRPALRRAPISWLIDDADVERSQEWFARRGPIVILLGRFVPGTRLPTYFAAGLLETGFWRFSLFAFIAVLLWAPLLVGAAAWLGGEVAAWFELYERWALPVFFGLILCLLFVTKVVVPSFTWRGRRLVVGSFRRLWRWEFWPPWLFYFPLVLNFLWLALRHRSLSVFTAVNPAMPAGGFIGESKSEILKGLEHAPEHLARTLLLPGRWELERKVDEAVAFMERHGLDWPVVLKPDAGQRGSGVSIVRARGELAAWLAGMPLDSILQEHVVGEEFGVFYYRKPGEPGGRIFSITRKEFPAVIGDGERTLEELILTDERAVCMAPVYAAQLVERLFEVPAEGQKVRLVEVGNHARGAIFLDGAELETPAMLETFDRISRGYEGFYFGRYDVRATSTAELQEGRGFKIMELNGATSEATHIYDPRVSLWRAYGTLFEQWRILFDIGIRNAARGAPVVHWTRLVKELGRYRRVARSHPA